MNWDYIAGFFDGEGALGKYKDNGYKLSISQANEKVLKGIQAFTKKGHVCSVKKSKPHWKDAWVYYIAKEEDVCYFLSKVYNKLIVKKDSVAFVLPTIRKRVTNRNKKRIEAIKRINSAKILRSQGLSYREIGEKLHIDWGYVRRAILGLK